MTKKSVKPVSKPDSKKKMISFACGKCKRVVHNTKLECPDCDGA